MSWVIWGYIYNEKCVGSEKSGHVSLSKQGTVSPAPWALSSIFTGPCHPFSPSPDAPSPPGSFSAIERAHTKGPASTVSKYH
jgi:hypothetical protein